MTNQYEYQMINNTLEPLKPDGERPTIADTANRWAGMGWRTVAYVPSKGPGYAECLMVERLKEETTVIEYRTIHNHHPSELCGADCPVYQDAIKPVD